MRLAAALCLVLCGVAQADPLTLRLSVDPPQAEVWMLRDEGYQFVGPCTRPLVIEVPAADMGKRPYFLKLFYRRPGEKGIPERAVPITFQPAPGGLIWPAQGVYSLPLWDRLLARPHWLAVLGLAAGAAALAAQSQLKKRRQQESRGQLADAARALASSFQKEQLLDFLSASISRSIPHESGLIWRQDRLLANWGAPPARAGALPLSEYLAQHDHLQVDEAKDWPFPAPLEGTGAMLSVGLSGRGFLLLQRPKRFREEDRAALLALSGPISQALEAEDRGGEGLQRLAAGMAHELNTPLGAILLSVESAMNVLDRSPDMAQSRLEKATLAVDRAHLVVSDLLLFSRSKLEDPRPLEWPPLLAGLGVEVQGEEWPGAFQGDAEMLKRALTHLVQNARDAGARSIVLQVSGNSFSLRDDGRGMSDEVSARACEPFFTTRPGGRGSGLGLAVARRVFELHGAQLSLESEVGQGTTVTIQWPA